MAHTLDVQINATAPLTPRRAAPLTRRGWVLLGILVICTAALYARTMTFSFIGYDDPRYIVDDWHIQQGLNRDTVRWAFSDTLSGNWYPLTLLVHLTVATLFGVKPWAFHGLNCLLHAASAALLFLFLWRTTARVWPAALATALWAWHPLRVESVAWAAETKDVLCGCLSIGCMLAYAHWRSSGGVGKYLLACLLLALALMSKPMAVTLPAVLLLLDYWPLSNPNRSWRSWLQRFVEKLPLMLLSLAAAGVAVFTQHQTRATGTISAFPLDLRWKNALLSYCSYLGKALWPANLGVFYPHPAMINASIPAIRWAAAGGLLVMLTLLVFRFARRRPYLFVGWFWFLGTLLPVIGLLQVGEQAMADRYTYFPLIGITVAIVWLLADLLEGSPALRQPAVALGGVACLALAAATFRQSGHWQNNEALFAHANAVIPNNYLARGILSGYARVAGHHDEALNLGESAVALSPRSQAAHHYFALALQAVGRRKEALREYKAAARLNQFEPQVRNDMGGLLVEEGRNTDAIEQFRIAVHWDPYFTMARHNLAQLLAAEGKYDDAIEQWRTAVRLAPGNGFIHGWLAEALRLRGDRAGALEHYRAAYAAGERNPMWEAYLAWFVATDPSVTPQQVQEILPAARDAAVNATKNQAFTLDVFAAALARCGQFNDAVETAKQAADHARSEGQLDLLRAIEARLTRYRAGLPYLVGP